MREKRSVRRLGERIAPQQSLPLRGGAERSEAERWNGVDAVCSCIPCRRFPEIAAVASLLRNDIVRTAHPHGLVIARCSGTGNADVASVFAQTQSKNKAPEPGCSGSGAFYSSGFHQFFCQFSINRLHAFFPHNLEHLIGCEPSDRAVFIFFRANSRSGVSLQ